MSTKTKLFGMLIAGLAMGCVLGARLEYMTVSAKNARQVLKTQQEFRELFDMTDAEMVKNAKKVRQYFEDEKRQDTMAAAIALGIYKQLAEGKVDDAKFRALLSIGTYYRIYHGKGGDQQEIVAIDEAAKEYPEVAAEIAKK